MSAAALAALCASLAAGGVDDAPAPAPGPGPAPQQEDEHRPWVEGAPAGTSMEWVKRATAHDPERHEWTWVVLPIVTVNVDEGFGFGVVGAVYHHNGGVEPFRDDLSVRGFITTRLVQRHELRWEGLDVFGLPLRTRARLGLFSTVTGNYCGVGNDVTCDDDTAAEQARASGLREGTTAFDDFVRHYYLTRVVRPFGELTLRWKITDAPWQAGLGPRRIELVTSWRGSYNIPGSFLERGPYPGSLYARRFPDGEPGFSSTPLVGITVDDRDFEPSPTRGWFFEASLRGQAPFVSGAAWTWAGVDAALAWYAPLVIADAEHRRVPLVLAQRALVDVIVGDPATDDMAALGGVRDDSVFGGQWVGRGLRDRRGLGRIKAVEQIELRADLYTARVFLWRIDAGAAVFFDAGAVGVDVTDWGGDPWRVLFGGGLGLRFLFDRSILLRIDLAASPFEQIYPSFYTPVGFPF